MACFNFCIAFAGALTLRLKNIDVPSHVLVGNEARLSCEFDMEGGTLYSVKWYKDDNEFYRWEGDAYEQIMFPNSVYFYRVTHLDGYNIPLT